MLEIIFVVFSTKVVETLVFGIDEPSRIQEKRVGVDDQIAVENSRNDEPCIQFDELLEVPAVSLIFIVVDGNLVGKFKNGFVDHSATVDVDLERC